MQTSNYKNVTSSISGEVKIHMYEAKLSISCVHSSENFRRQNASDNSI